LRQAIVNLVGNAIKYTKKGGVKVKVVAERKTVAIVVEDTGIGISAQERKKLFQKFVRLPSGKRMGASGTGLGLWITHQIVGLMKGTIGVESIKGRGSRFTLTFPICSSKEEN
jgi:signal transduction histidine kinase